MTESPWLWPGWVPRGNLSLICGPPGAQTATVTAWLATTVLWGGPLPDGARIESDGGRQVMWIDTKRDDRPRACFTALAAPLDRVFGPYDPERPKTVVDLADDRWPAIVAELAKQERPCWVVVDGLGISRGDLGAGDRALNVMASIARDVGCAVTWLVEQPSRAAGWAQIMRRMRTILSINPWSTNSADLCLRVERSEGEPPRPLRIRIKDGIPAVVHAPATEPKTAVERAVVYLERELADGPRAALELIEAAKLDNRISKRSLERAKRMLGVRSYMKSRRWWWALTFGRPGSHHGVTCGRY